MFAISKTTEKKINRDIYYFVILTLKDFDMS